MNPDILEKLEELKTLIDAQDSPAVEHRLYTFTLMTDAHGKTYTQTIGEANGSSVTISEYQVSEGE